MTQERNIQVYSGHGPPPQRQDSQDPLKNIKGMIMAKRPTIMGIIPKGLDEGRLIRLSLIAVRKTPKLAQCSPQSVVGSVLQCAQLGLEPDGLLGQAYLVPFKDKWGKLHAQLMIGYKGMINLIMRSGKAANISTRLVYENDDFDISYGTDPGIHHKPVYKGDRGEVVGAYCVAKMTNGELVIDYMTRDEIEHVRNSGRSGNSDAWRNHWNEMARKCPIRRAFKYIPISTDLDTAIALDEANDVDKPQHNDLLIESDAELASLPIQVEVTRENDAEVPPAQQLPAAQPAEPAHAPAQAMQPPSQPLDKEAALAEVQAQMAAIQGRKPAEEPQTIAYPPDFEERIGSFGLDPGEKLEDGSDRFTMGDGGLIIDRITQQPLGVKQAGKKPPSKAKPKASKTPPQRASQPQPQPQQQLPMEEPGGVTVDPDQIPFDESDVF